MALAQIHDLDDARRRRGDAARSDAERTDETSDATLVRAAAQGDRRATSRLYERHHRLVAGLAFRLMGTREGLDDVVQDTFVAAIEGLPRLREGQAFAKWIGSITVRTAQRHIRRHRRRVRFGLVAGAELELDLFVSPSAPPDVTEELRRLYLGLSRVGAEERVALLLRRVEGYSNEEVAEALGVSLATAKRRIARASAKISEGNA